MVEWKTEGVGKKDQDDDDTNGTRHPKSDVQSVFSTAERRKKAY